jgi:hypothetical protein
MESYGQKYHTKNMLPERSKLKILLVIAAVGGLLLTLIPSILNWQGIMGPEKVNNLMLAGTIIWFASASFLFLRKDPE